ncbi:MAG: adenosylcobinamide-phosphate synthase CbiB [Meiothermus sp.]|uniref:adenosylcobinamide-phosphate synthase CbiB n=1 Tax=Meiothermus sp. TaxID=1955249 RepID=UPI00298F0C87|nr:adenosylcobinamide-phosphate synthase CbiB [Meiothermus sp.]MDW8089786.1 adenosylcobinamide-phosphate synthase CbiB [Meiothermus sp.]
MSILLALVLDWRFGEPPAKAHPVVLMGRYLQLAGRGLTRHPPRSAFWRGALFWCLGAGAFAGGYGLLEWALGHLPFWLGLLLSGLLLKPLFAFRMLLEEARAVEEALERGLEGGRERLRYLVSRDTQALSESEVRESLLESAAENLSDSVVAPLFWYLLLGLPGAALYRFANTADAMWGYRGAWEWGGKWAARADDLLNWLPARLTAGLLWLISRRFSFRSLLQEARKTPSPNAGWPMAALALALDLRLSKPGVYTLNPSGHPPRPEEVARGLQMVAQAGWLGGLLLASIEAWPYILKWF